jgi:hypothetical protein
MFVSKKDVQSLWITEIAAYLKIIIINFLFTLSAPRLLQTHSFDFQRDFLFIFELKIILSFVRDTVPNNIRYTHKELPAKENWLITAEQKNYLIFVIKCYMFRFNEPSSGLKNRGFCKI